MTDWEAEARKWEKRSKDNYAKLKEAEPKLAELDQIKLSNQSELERATNELTRWQTEAETWRTAAVSHRIEALASAAGFEYPDLAVRELDASKYLDAGGQIDEAAMNADLAEVLDKYPKLRRDAFSPAPRVPAPNPAQGTGGRPAVNPAQEFAALIQGQLRS